MKPTLAAAVVAGVLAAGLAGCSGTDAPASEPSAGPTVDPGPPLEVGARLWGTKETGIRGVTAFEPRGDRTILAGYGDYAEADTHVLGVDTRTGDVAWRRTLYEPVPGADGAVLWDDAVAVGAGADAPVAVTLYDEGATPGTYLLTVALLDPATGRLDRLTAATARGASDADPYLTVVDATEDVLVVDVTWVGDDARPARTLGVDLDTGRVRWERRGSTASVVVDGTVLASDTYQLDAPAPGRWRALDADDGTTTWLRESPTESLVGLAEGLAVFFEPEAEPGLPDGVVVDLATGDDLLEVPSDAAATDVGNDFGSERSPGSLVAWLDDEDHLVTYAAGEDGPTTSEETVTAPLFAVVGDQVTHSGPGPDAVNRQGVVDRLGTPVDVGGGGVLFFADDDLVVTGSYQGPFAVLRRDG